MIRTRGDDLAAQAQAMVRAILVAQKAAVTGATEYARQAIRQQVRAAGLGERLPNAVRSRVYPVGERLAFAPAGLIYANGKKAAAILSALSEGVVIRGKRAQGLAIPLAAAPRGRWGTPLTPTEVERRYGRPLVALPLRGQRARVMLCMPMPRSKAAKAAPARLPLAVAGAGRADRVNRLVPMFILVPSVTLARRLQPETAMQAAEASMPGLFRASLERMMG